MYLLKDHSKRIVAYLHDHLIMLPESFEVIGLIIGETVFGINGGLKGTFRHKTLYSTTGEKIGEGTIAHQTPGFDHPSMVRKTWQVLTHIKDHTCPLIIPQNRWAGMSLTDVLKQ